MIGREDIRTFGWVNLFGMASVANVRNMKFAAVLHYTLRASMLVNHEIFWISVSRKTFIISRRLPRHFQFSFLPAVIIKLDLAALCYSASWLLIALCLKPFSTKGY